MGFTQGANDPDRAAWLEAQKTAIFAAKSVGELKRTLADAIDIATGQNDGLAVDQLNAWAGEKAAEAKDKKAKEAA